ncbi:MAG TPA: hypothetical protein VEB66_16880 [Opitutaceae bacterium]|nr:hypothetical protein [Opitutaceae bacterium]
MNLFRPFVTGLALLCLPAAGLLAQQPSPPPARDPNVLTIDFPGGPLSKLVDAMERGNNTQLSIIQAGGLDPTLPAFSVRNANTDSVIVALGRLLEPEGYHLTPTGPNLAVLTKIEKAVGQPSRSERKQFTVLPLEKRIGNQHAQVVIQAIQAGCEFASEDKANLRFQYHEATKLLFVSGSVRDIEIAHKIFGSLPELPPAPESKPETRK